MHWKKCGIWLSHSPGNFAFRGKSVQFCGKIYHLDGYFGRIHRSYNNTTLAHVFWIELRFFMILQTYLCNLNSWNVKKKWLFPIIKNPCHDIKKARKNSYFIINLGLVTYSKQNFWMPELSLTLSSHLEIMRSLIWW